MEIKPDGKKIKMAILVGTPDYINLKSLPACAHDIKKMKSLLDATEKYDLVEAITDTNSDKVKDKIREIFNKYRGTDIDELFFYFTGHGTYERDDVLLCCGNFDEKTPATTSLTNSELDDLIRGISPELTVKILDACRSGAQYIKDSENVFDKALHDAKSKLKKFYCMSSSQLDQSSYASADLSYFTQKFIEGATRKDSGTIYYRDIVSFIADSFAETEDQTPSFVHQGDGLEEFSKVNQKIVALRQNTAIKETTTEESTTELDKIITSNDTLYVTEEIVSKSLIESVELLKKAQLTDPTVNRYYNKEVEVNSSIEKLDDIKELAAWAANDSLDKRFLIKIENQGYWSEEISARYIPALSTISSLANLSTEQANQPRRVRRFRPVSISNLHKFPIETVSICFRPKNHPSLKTLLMRIAIIHSRTEVMVLAHMGILTSIGWNLEKLDSKNSKWTYKIFFWKDLVSDPALLWKIPFESGENAVKAYLVALTESEQKKIPEGDAATKADMTKKD
jgi:hypothetical protein